MMQEANCVKCHIEAPVEMSDAVIASVLEVLLRSRYLYWGD